MKILIDILARLLLVCFLLIITGWRLIFGVFRLYGALLYNFFDFQFEELTFEETKTAFEELKEIPMDVISIMKLIITLR